MPVTIDITQDLRYRQGVDEGMRRGIERMAVMIMKEGFGIAAAQRFTGLQRPLLEKLALQIQQENLSSPKST